MGNELNNNKPANPAPPLNALKNPEVKPEAKKERPVRRSVYDEIAERRKREKHKIGVSNGSDSSDAAEQIKFRFGDEISDIIDEVKLNREEDDVKVYHPEKHKTHPVVTEAKQALEEFPTDIYSDDGEEFVDDEDNYDVPPIPKAPRHIGKWVALISALSVLCVIAAGAYGIVNGYFDGIISLL
ncbi:MAG: hypothetical protein IJ932_01070 [Ruminococcus sp.]|nr:hypothetical protein [Ruminococcus sp.]